MCRHVDVLKENIQDPFEYSYDICHECEDYGRDEEGEASAEKAAGIEAVLKEESTAGASVVAAAIRVAIKQQQQQH